MLEEEEEKNICQHSLGLLQKRCLIDQEKDILSNSLTKKRRKIQASDNESSQEVYQEICSLCGNQWDGNAQCPCFMYTEDILHLDDEEGSISLNRNVAKTLDVVISLKIDVKKYDALTMNQIETMIIKRISSSTKRDTLKVNVISMEFQGRYKYM